MRHRSHWRTAAQGQSNFIWCGAHVFKDSCIGTSDDDDDDDDDDEMVLVIRMRVLDAACLQVVTLFLFCVCVFP
jgi:hypothetical protein